MTANSPASVTKISRTRLNNASPGPCGRRLTQGLEYPCGAHAAADAHRDHAVAAAAPFQLAQDGRRQLRPRAAQRVAERDGAAVDVDAFGVEPERLDDGEALRGERLVELDDVDVLKLEAGHLQDLRDGV